MGLDTDFTKFVDGMLCGFGFQLSRGFDKRHQSEVNVQDVFTAHIKRHLSNGFEKGQTFDVPDRSSYFHDHHVRPVRHAEYRLFDFVGNMRDDLHRAAQIIAPALFLDDRVVNSSRRAIVVLREREVGKSFIVPEIEIGLGPVVRDWDAMVQKLKRPTHEVTIGMVGKYMAFKESYKSLSEALVHGGLPDDAGVNIRLIESEELERGSPEQFLSDADGILIPGGFGTRGIEGKVTTIRYAREKGIPFLGLCLGMQCAVVEFARHVAGLEGANSGEFDSATDYKVIDLLPEQRTVEEKGGSMRLGSYICRLQEGSLAQRIYGTAEVKERHRHRYEFNNDFREILTAKGLVFSGTSPDGRLVEIIELQNHPWFLGTQFHPEYRSRPHAPHPVFQAFIHAALKRKFGR